MFSFGTGDLPPDLEDELALQMMLLLQEHGWEFTYGRDPLLILIEIEEYLTGEKDES